MLLLKTKNLDLEIGGEVLQRAMNIELEEGQGLWIQGRNGSGKTLLLKTLLGFVPSPAGKVEWTLPKNQIRYLPQVENPFFHIPLLLGDLMDKAKAQPFEGWIPNVGFWSKSWNQASGGEKKKTLLLRILTEYPKVLLLDEPFNHLDPGTKTLLWKYFDSLLIDLKRPHSIIVVSHEPHPFQNGSHWKELVLA